MLDGDDRFLESGAEWNCGEHNIILVLLSHELMDWLLSILHPLDKRDFSALALRNVEGVVIHLNVGRRVPDDALNDLLLDLLVQLAVLESIGSRVQHLVILSEEAVYGHLLGGHGASLTENKVSDLTNSLDAIDVTDKKVIILAHLQDAVGKRDCDGHGETFRNGNDQQDQGNDDAIDHSLGELVATKLFVDTLVDEEDEKRGAEDND